MSWNNEEDIYGVISYFVKNAKILINIGLIVIPHPSKRFSAKIYQFIWTVI